MDRWLEDNIDQIWSAVRNSNQSKLKAYVGYNFKKDLDQIITKYFNEDRDDYLIFKEIDDLSSFHLKAFDVKVKEIDPKDYLNKENI